MNRKSGRRVPICLAGIVLLAGLTHADLRYLRGYSWVYPNEPPYDDGFYAKVKRFPLGDSCWAPIMPIDGRYWLDLHDMSAQVQFGDTLLLHSYNVNDSEQCANLVIPVDSSMLIQGDTLPHEYKPHSVFLQNPGLGTVVFCVDMKRVVDTSQTPGQLMVAFWTTGSDTAHVSIPPCPERVTYDSLQLNTQLLDKNVEDGQPVSMRIYKGEWSDTTSMFTDTTVYIQRQIGRFQNDATRVPNTVFPKTVLHIDESKGQYQEPQRSRMKTPCGAVDLERCVREDGGRVEVIDVSGRRWWPEGFSSLPPGVYLLRYLDDLTHTEKVVLQ